MTTRNNEIEILKLLEESGITENYNEVPHNFYNKEIFIKTPLNTTNTNNFSLSEAANKAKNLIKDITNINDLQNTIQTFTESPLFKHASHIITGTGTASPTLLVITETPSSEEDRSGENLTGETGELLKKILSAIHCSTETNTFVLPASPYRAPGGRLPSKEEIEITSPFLFKFIELLKPQVILTMGALPMNLLLNKDCSIAEIRGTWQKYNDIDLMPTFSLQFLLNNNEAKRKIWNEDLQFLMKKLG